MGRIGSRLPDAMTILQHERNDTMHSLPSTATIPSRCAAVAAISVFVWLLWTNSADLRHPGRDASIADRFGHVAGLNQGWSLFAYATPPKRAVFPVAVLELPDGTEVERPSEFLPANVERYYRSPFRHPRIFIYEFTLTAAFADDDPKDRKSVV